VRPVVRAGGDAHRVGKSAPRSSLNSSLTAVRRSIELRTVAPMFAVATALRIIQTMNVAYVF
jgi:hypothetical protein